jgi:hypothetical protein
MVDHRSTQGLDEATVRLMGLPAGAGTGLFETHTYTCSHCKVVVVMNPLRTRERAYCRGCDHYICDPCGKARAAAGNVCMSFDSIVEKVQEAALKQTPEQVEHLAGQLIITP